MARHVNRDVQTGQFAKIPPPDLAVDDRSGDPVAEHAEPGGRTVYFEVHREQDGPLRHRRLLVHDAESGEVVGEIEPTVARRLWPGAMQRMAMHDAAGSDEFAQALTGGTPGGVPVDSPPRDLANPRTVTPASRGDGRARSRA